jgi:nucleoside-diphosphate-sugar epimerase
MGNGEQMIQPVHISDVIATVTRCLETDVKTRQIINVVGEQPINYRDWLIALRSHAGKSINNLRFIKIPFPIMLKLSLLGRLIHHPFFNPENLRMLQQNNMADSSKLRAFLGRKPLSVSETIHKSKPANRNQP